jgi:hypothetical protein
MRQTEFSLDMARKIDEWSRIDHRIEGKESVGQENRGRLSTIVMRRDEGPLARHSSDERGIERIVLQIRASMR